LHPEKYIPAPDSIIADSGITVDDSTAKAREEERQATEKKFWTEVDSVKKELGKADLITLISNTKTPAEFAAAMLKFGIPKKAIDLNTPTKDYGTLLRTAMMIYCGTVQLGGPAYNQLIVANTTTEDGLTKAIADLTGRVEKVESDISTVQGEVSTVQGAVVELENRLETIRKAVNTNGVNTAACLELLKSAKSQKKPKEAGRVAQAVSDAQHQYSPIEFKMESTASVDSSETGDEW